MTMTTAAPVRPWDMFDVEVSRVHRISPSLVRVTFTGSALDGVADRGYDQRIKLILPADGGSLADLPRGEDWFARWRLMPTDTRPVVRTYTIRSVRPEVAELDIDMVDHGATGPASRFAVRAGPGDAAVLLAPVAEHEGEHGGLEFRRDLAETTDQLIVGDDTAVPAVCAIVERLPRTARGLVSLEVAAPEDVLDLPAPSGVEVVWSVRGTERGAEQVAVVRAWLDAHSTVGSGSTGETTVYIDGEGDEGGYWEVTTARNGDVPPLSAWIAGESSVVKSLRRLLVGEYDVPRSAVAFMGYWREGRSEC